jgi:xylan 1,4-beta-xylosidase
MQRIDEEHANPRRLWKEIGAPEYLNSSQVDYLHDASQLKREPIDFEYTNREIDCEVTVPPNGVAAIEFEFAPNFQPGGHC